MPNHVTHRMVVTGPAKELKRFREEHIVLEDREGSVAGEERFDFNRIIPRPEQLDDVKSGGHGDIGYRVWYGPDEVAAPKNDNDLVGMIEQMRGTWKGILDYPWVPKVIQTREELQEYLLAKDPQYKEQADRYKRNIDSYGYPTWYEWSLARWGTKWNSYSFEWVKESARKLEFKFDTAWGTPLPVFQALSMLFPSLSFNVMCFDEGWGFAMAGEFHDRESTYEDVEVNDEIHEKVYGYPPEKDQEEG